MTNLYHFELGFPKGLKTNFGIVTPTYTRHAKNAAESDRYGHMDLPRTIDTSKAKAIEVEVTDDTVTKIVYRMKYNDELDIILVLTNDCVAKTVWFNRRSDKHKTLDKSKYTVLKAA